MEEKPYVGFVVIGRNDDYGHRFLFRVQNFFDNLTYLCEKYHLPSEIIFVEWNPPANKDHIWKELKMRGRKWLKFRFITVSEKVHKSLNGPDNLPLLEFVGKNAAIRRSDSEYIICTNPDILFNEPLIRFLSERKIKENCFYKVDRYNLGRDLPEKINPDRIGLFCKKNYLNVLGFPMNYYREGLKNHIKEALLALRDVFHHVWYHLVSKEKYDRILTTDGAPGDFTLMSKNSWSKIKGYPELHVQGFGDIYNVAMARTFLKLIKLRSPMRAYHQYHPSPTNRPSIDYAEFKKNVDYMLDKRKIIEFNTDNWGLKGIKLEETVF